MTIFEISIFGLTIAPSYYGLMYALGFILGYIIIQKRGYITGDKLDNLLFYIFLGVILGGRLGYTMFYNFTYYIQNIPDIFKIWEGGMSFHGGTIGVIIALIVYAKRNKINIWRLGDEVTAIIPIGLGFGRIGNYLNKELLGYTPYNGPLFIEKGGINYFPSPLLESALEGVVLFIILWYVYTKRKFYGQVAAIFLIFYGIFRIFVEAFFRTPDVQLGYIMGYFTMGEILSLPMIIAGIWIYIRQRKITSLCPPDISPSSGMTKHLLLNRRKKLHN